LRPRHWLGVGLWTYNFKPLTLHLGARFGAVTKEGVFSPGREGTTHAPEAANQAASLTSIFLGWARAGFGIVIFKTPFDMVA
jgi:hypothetical protein